MKRFCKSSLGNVKCYVHQRTTFWYRMALVKSSICIDSIVNQLRFFLDSVFPSLPDHRRHPPTTGQPCPTHKLQTSEACSTSIHACCMVSVLKVAWQRLATAFQQITPYDYNCHARRPSVLLCTGINQTILIDGQRTTKKVARRITDQRNRVRTIRLTSAILNTLNRLVAAIVQISSIITLTVKVPRRGNAVVIGML